MKEHALLITVDFYSIRRDSDPKDLAEELTELSTGAGLSVAGDFLFKQDSPNAALFLGKGQAEKIRLEALKKKAGVVVFESDLSPSQQRNLEEIIGVKTIDRTQLILDIFARRARSNEGKLQVELAQLKYLLPRLAGKGIYLSRLGGGVGTRGPGEQKLEVDRRRIRDKIVKLSRDLTGLQQRRQTAIVKKKEKDLPLLALVGYTNAGKSSLFNRLTESKVLVKDQLFSTLDTTTRLLELPHNQKVFLADTVGFVRDLPHHLVESFKATLEETVHADILLHVMDATRHDLPVIEQAVEKVLSEIGAADKKTFLVLNKADLLDKERRAVLNEYLQTDGVFLVSSLTGEGIRDLLSSISEGLGESRYLKEFFIPQNRLNLTDLIYRETEVLERRDSPEGVYLKVRASLKIGAKIENQLPPTPS